MVPNESRELRLIAAPLLIVILSGEKGSPSPGYSLEASRVVFTGEIKACHADSGEIRTERRNRYGKEDAITTDTKSLSRDCQLGDVKVRFFGDSIAIAYGAENRMIKDDNGKETKRCQVWTDTWLKRAGKWQIVAAQDTIVGCNL